MSDVFLISPVAGTEIENHPCAPYVQALEEVCSVHWPIRDTEQEDPSGGIRILRDNLDEIRTCGVVHHWYSPGSTGSMFDLGGTFMAGKPYVVANVLDVFEAAQEQDGKCFEKAMLRHYEEWLRSMILMYHNEEADDFIEANSPITADIIKEYYPAAANALCIPEYAAGAAVECAYLGG